MTRRARTQWAASFIDRTGETRRGSREDAERWVLDAIEAGRPAVLVSRISRDAPWSVHPHQPTHPVSCG